MGALIQFVNSATGTAYLPSFDGNGNVASLINLGTGALAAAYEYSPYGEMLRDEIHDNAVAPFALRFSTKWRDAETSWLNYGRRYFDPRNGRFIGRDPIAEKGGINLYAFCGNNPVDRWDRLGMEEDGAVWDPVTLTYTYVIPAFLNPNSGAGSTLGNALRNIPLLGGMLGAIGDVISGVGNTALGVVTLGASGTLSTGLIQIGSGVGNAVEILGADAIATVAGAVGTVMTTTRAVADMVTLGNVMSGGNPLKAVGNLIGNIAIPEFGMFGGYQWGTTQGRGPGSILNQSDVASYNHDRNMNEIQWIETHYFGRPTAIPVGPVGAVYALIGTIPFGLKGLIDGEHYP